MAVVQSLPEAMICDSGAGVRSRFFVPFGRGYLPPRRAPPGWAKEASVGVIRPRPATRWMTMSSSFSSRRTRSADVQGFQVNRRGICSRRRYPTPPAPHTHAALGVPAGEFLPALRPPDAANLRSGAHRFRCWSCRITEWPHPVGVMPDVHVM